MTEFLVRKKAGEDALVTTLWKILIDHAKAQPKSGAVHCRLSAMNPDRGGAIVIATTCLLVGFGSTACAQTHSRILSPVQKEAVMTNHASGTFEVKLNPQKPDNKEAERANLARMSIDKQFYGDLEGSSKGEMLSAVTDVKGSAGYVAIERVGGTLNGRRGTFVLQHSGTMTRGALQMSITVVPDSGTGQLVGVAGTMMIKIGDGKHSYEFEYTITEGP